MRPRNVFFVALVAVSGHGCLFAFAPDGEGASYNFEPFDPAAGETGEATCGSVDPDGTCHPPSPGIPPCVCPWEYRCAGPGTVDKCFGQANGTCTVRWRDCGGWSESFPGKARAPSQTCIEDGPVGTGCYVEGSLQSDGWVRHCSDLEPCENGTSREDCVLMPQIISVDFTVPSVGGAEYSCFEDCRHTLWFGARAHECGACCDACNISATEGEALCAGGGSGGTGGGGSTCSDLLSQYPKTGNACIDRCIDDAFACFSANDCVATAACGNAYSACLQQCT